MTEIFIIILPLVLLVAAGLAITKAGLLSPTDWQSIEKLSFKILIPALIIQSIYNSDLSLETAGPYVIAMILTITGIGVITLFLRPISNWATLTNPELSSMVQVTTRWNAFIVLPVAAQLFRADGLAAVAIAMAFLIPLINVVNIIVVSSLHSREFNALSILKTILNNPMVIGSAIGLAINFSGMRPPQVIESTLTMVSRSTLAIGLLCIGAGFNWRRLLRPSWQVVWGVVAKNLIAPLIFLGLALPLDLGQLETICGMLVVSAPAATNGYIVARQMGGDAELYAYTLSWQLVASILTIPLLLYLTGSA